MMCQSTRALGIILVYEERSTGLTSSHNPSYRIPLPNSEVLLGSYCGTLEPDSNDEQVLWICQLKRMAEVDQVVTDSCGHVDGLRCCFVVHLDSAYILKGKGAVEAYKQTQ